MIFIVWLIAGGLIGWLASSIMRPEAEQGAALDVVVGVVGAVLGGWLIAPLFGAGSLHQNDFSAAGLMSSLLGAVVLLAIVNLVRRGGITFATMDFTPAELERHYQGFCNGTLWPLFHYFLGGFRFFDEQYESYIAVNQRFARELFQQRLRTRQRRIPLQLGFNVFSELRCQLILRTGG